MSKSELTEAAYEQNLNEVRKLIAAGAAVDGAECEKWRGTATGCVDGAPYYTPLGEACRSTDAAESVQLEIVGALLAAGAPVNELNYRGETALHFAAQAGRATVAKRLVEAGANVACVGCLGNAVAASLNGEEPGRVAVVRALLDLGVNPRLPDPDGRTLVDLLGDLPACLASGSREAKRPALAVLEQLEAIAMHPSGAGWIELTQLLELARAAGAKGAAKSKKSKRALTGLLDAVGQKDWADQVKRAIGKKASGRHEKLEQLTKVVLQAPAAVAHPAWADLVRALLALTVSYEDHTEAYYGERIPVSEMDSDEGGAFEGYADLELSTVDLCLIACQAPGASERNDFEALVSEICGYKTACVGSMSTGDDEAVDLARALGQHPSAAKLVPILREAFPFASWA